MNSVLHIFDNSKYSKKHDIYVKKLYHENLLFLICYIHNVITYERYQFVDILIYFYMYKYGKFINVELQKISY